MRQRRTNPSVFTLPVGLDYQTQAKLRGQFLEPGGRKEEKRKEEEEDEQYAWHWTSEAERHETAKVSGRERARSRIDDGREGRTLDVSKSFMSRHKRVWSEACLHGLSKRPSRIRSARSQ